MGMYDSVEVICPHCHESTRLQSKAGNCMLETYRLDNAPLSVLGDLADGGGWRKCEHCEELIEIEGPSGVRFGVKADKTYDESDLLRRIKRLEKELGIGEDE